MKKINKIGVERIIDDNPQLDYLGTFSDVASEFAVELNGGRNSYKFFNAENVENMKQAKQNYNRIMQYDSGGLCDYGVKATADIITRMDDNAKYENGKIMAGNWVHNKITSGGVWGLSSDGTDEDFKNEEESQLEELQDVLKEFGFSDSEIKNAKLGTWNKIK